MRRIKQSFVEVIAGESHKEHYVNVSVILALVSLTVGLLLILVTTYFNINVR